MKSIRNYINPKVEPVVSMETVVTEVELNEIDIVESIDSVRQVSPNLDKEILDKYYVLKKEILELKKKQFEFKRYSHISNMFSLGLFGLLMYKLLI